MNVTARRISRCSRWAAAAVAFVGALALAGCSSAPAAAPEPSAPSETLTGRLSVYAAASLGGAFDRIAEEFQADNEGLDILPVVYDGSSTLATQIVEGAPADVFASADEKNLAKVDGADLVMGSPRVFATNTLVIVVPAGNPGEVESLADLSDPTRTVILCAPEVPCGSASQKLFANAGVAASPVSLEQNVTAVLTKVAAGEADAGLVYRTDVAGRDDVEAILPEGAADVVNRYPIAALSDASNPAAADAFVRFVLSPRGQEILAEFGFGAP